MTNAEINQIAKAVASEITKSTLHQKEVLSIDEVVLYTGISRSTIYKLTHARKIPFSKPNGKMCFFSRTEIDKWLMGSPVATETELNTQVKIYCMRNKLPRKNK